MTVVQLRVEELTGVQLDACVAHALGLGFRICNSAEGRFLRTGRAGSFDLCTEGFRPSSDWAVGGPIIEREKIAVYHVAEAMRPETAWVAGTNLRVEEGFCGSELTGSDPDTLELDNAASGPTPLAAAMRAYVTSKFGDTVELPV